MSARRGSPHASASDYILVVDDDEAIRETVADVLREEGYAVETCHNGVAALALVSEGSSGQGNDAEPGVRPQPPDAEAGGGAGENSDSGPRLILLDMRMPVMDGWSFAAAYQALPGHHAPICVMTAAPDAAAHAAEIGAAAVLSKPFELDTLLATVAQYLGASAGAP